MAYTRPLYNMHKGVNRCSLCNMTKIRGYFWVIFVQYDENNCVTIWWNCTRISIQLGELCIQLKCYKNVTNVNFLLIFCVTPWQKNFFSLIQKIPTDQNFNNLSTLSTHLSTTNTWEIPLNIERRTICKYYRD